MQDVRPGQDGSAAVAKQELRQFRCEHVRIVRDLLDPEGDGLGEDTYQVMELYLDGNISLSEFADEMGAPFLIMSLPRPGYEL